MSRSVSMQFRHLGRQEAIDYLGYAPKIGENVGDRIAAQRRVDYVTTAEEREASRRDVEQFGRPLKVWS